MRFTASLFIGLILCILLLNSEAKTAPDKPMLDKKGGEEAINEVTIDPVSAPAPTPTPKPMNKWAAYFHKRVKQFKEEKQWENMFNLVETVLRYHPGDEKIFGLLDALVEGLAA